MNYFSFLFSQDLHCLDDLSIFSPPTDSLTEYTVNNLINTDMPPNVPTIWDIKTPASVQESFAFCFSSQSYHVFTQRPQTQPEEEEEVEVEEAEELGHVDTYADYRPSKSKIGISHPDRVVETNTLSSVPPPDITYTLSIPETTINSGQLSALQLEAIIYTCQQHEVILQNNQRAGFLIGDGAGVGKGRTVAGIILENYLKGRKKALWFSVSNDLKYDAERDLQDIGAPNIQVHALNKIKYGDTATSEGVLFATYSALIGESQAGGQLRTRLKQILDWCEPVLLLFFAPCHQLGIEYRVLLIVLLPTTRFLAADELCMSSTKSLWGQFWSSHQRFFKYLCIAAKVRCLVELAKKELEAGKCVVIGLQSTGEARTREVLDENDGHLDRFVSAAEGVFQSLVLKHFPSEKQMREKGAGNKRKRKPRGRQPKQPRHGTYVAGVINISDDSSTESDVLDSDSNSSPDSVQDNNDDVIFVDQTTIDLRFYPSLARLEEKKQGLLNKIAELGKELPLNTLDELIDKFGGPEQVSEMTGRKGRVVRRPDGSVQYESRAEQSHTIDQINIKEKDRFMNGEKLVAIISEAASSGISLQADRRVKNQRRRVHMTLELPWSADRAIQQFGRTHRSNQVTAPEYIFLISELAGERRFASIVAKRLESLGALTHGDRRATESRDLSKYNFENKYGTKALDKTTKAILGQIESKVPPPQDYPGGDAMFFRDMKHGMKDVGMLCSQSRLGISTEKDCNISKFLNRILGLEVHKQNSLFQYFTDNFDYLIEKDKKEGKYDMGILDLAPGNDQIYEETQEKFLTAGNPQDGQVILYKISVDRGMPWLEALQKAQTLSNPDEGFYLSHKLRGNYPCVLLAVQGQERNMIIYKPNIGKQAQTESLENLQHKYRKVTPEEARDSWENQFTFSFRKCSHANWCKKVDEGQECLMGTRLRQYHMLCGALLRVWKRVSDVVADITSSSILQIVRLKTKDSSKQVGIKIPENCISKVRQELVRMDAEVKQRRREKEQQAQEQRQAEEQQRLMAQRQLQDFFTPNLFTTLQPPNMPSLPTPYVSFPSFPSIKNPLEEILDLTLPNSSSSSQVSTQADLGVDNLSRQADPTLAHTQGCSLTTARVLLRHRSRFHKHEILLHKTGGSLVFALFSSRV
uniref:Strawberry notch homolog 2 n=1 Tax=Cyprinus carpio TaxID=7962 RepID=A0A8C2E6S4_CYPCA